MDMSDNLSPTDPGIDNAQKRRNRMSPEQKFARVLSTLQNCRWNVDDLLLYVFADRVQPEWNVKLAAMFSGSL